MDGKKMLAFLLLVTGLAAVFYGLLSHGREMRGSQLANFFSAMEPRSLALPVRVRPSGEAAMAAADRR